MKRQLSALLLTLAVASPAFADKPEWAGKGKPTAEQKEARSAAIESRKGMQQEIDEHGGKLKKEKTKKEKPAKKSKQGDDSAYDAHDSDHDSDDARGREHDSDSDSDELMGMEKQKEKKTKEAKQDHDSDPDKLKGLEKQKAMKSEQEQKELGRGSEQGQEARQDRRKWWKFWGE